ncbi:ABC transporter substrate-binding protein [Enterovirga sp.]|jgi:iron complex transport system substrate-binding protein|uniref:ABC transporter substrate-binding protein n=1 Tax=Enterovirga sp. TaxID=2026350 RepID=UPI002610E7EF|nr:ABC transporter substrate-binding protein [Enterovirga sp.]
MLHRWVLLLAAVAALVSAPSYASAGGRPTFISINACTDQLLIALADPDQILGVTRYARDPEQSPLAEQAARLPAVSGTAEEVLAGQPDIVLAGRFTRRATREFIRARGFRIVEYDAARSLDEAKRNITEVARLVGHPERGEAALQTIDLAIARARAASAGRTGTVLPLQRRGWISGQDTLTTSLVEAIGLRNAGAVLSRGLGRQVSLEQIVALRPDYLLLSGSGRAEDQGSALLQHPALAALYPPEKRIAMPDRLVFCGGPSLAGAIDALVAEVARLPR